MDEILRFIILEFYHFNFDTVITPLISEVSYTWMFINNFIEIRNMTNVQQIKINIGATNNVVSTYLAIQ